jgi:uncharacterized protein YbgA (DUF1722 family)/uncharacterized protein YbbK (DUF523 family)
MTVKLGISACLLGERVRYDGGHKLDEFLRDTLGRYVQYVPVCPEVECGMPTPREAVRLVGDPDAPRLLTQKTKRDLTSMMLEWTQRKLDDLEGAGLHGFVFKAKSPSSGMERVKIYDEAGNVQTRGPGLFAREFMRRFPLLPVEDEGRLHDPDLRENFIERIFALARYREALAAEPSIHGLMAFHERHKLLILAHHERLGRAMGRQLAGAARRDFARVRGEYEESLLAALRCLATPARHTNVLMHMQGYFKERLSADEKQELLEIIFAYKAGNLPLIVPVTLLQHHVRKHGIAYLREQAYLNPHPLELRLRNHA